MTDLRIGIQFRHLEERGFFEQDLLEKQRLLWTNLDQNIKFWRAEGSVNRIPLVLSRAFKEWTQLLFSQFSCLNWKAEEYLRTLYERFYDGGVIELPHMKGLADQSKARLKEAGWEEYLRGFWP